jgi:hypothetical protein
MHLTTKRPGIDPDLAGAIANVLDHAGFTIADGSLSVHGLVLWTPGGYVQLTFSALDPNHDDRTPDRNWTCTPEKIPAWMEETGEHPVLPPIAGGSDEPDASFDEWLEHVDSLGYPPSNQLEPASDYLGRFNDERNPESEVPA